MRNSIFNNTKNRFTDIVNNVDLTREKKRVRARPTRNRACDYDERLGITEAVNMNKQRAMRLCDGGGGRLVCSFHHFYIS